MSVQAPVKWAQREDVLYLTIAVTDLQSPSIDLTEDKLVFKGIGGTSNTEHHAEIEFYGKVSTEGNKQRINARNIFMVINKKESGPYWPRLTKDKIKYPWLKVDFDHWKDEDESDAEDAEAANPMAGMGAMDPMGMGGMQDMNALMEQMKASGMDFSNMPGMSGDTGAADSDDEPDSDDDDLPSLIES
jgi:prostaglandin-E synthase